MSASHDGLIDPISEALIVHRTIEIGYLLVQSAQREERIVAEPFDAASLSLRSSPERAPKRRCSSSSE